MARDECRRAPLGGARERRVEVRRKLKITGKIKFVSEGGGRRKPRGGIATLAAVRARWTSQGGRTEEHRTGTAGLFGAVPMGKTGGVTSVLELHRAVVLLLAVGHEPIVLLLFPFR